MKKIINYHAPKGTHSHRYFAIVALAIAFVSFGCTEYTHAAPTAWEAKFSVHDFRKSTSDPIPGADSWPLGFTNTNVTLIKNNIGLNYAEIYYDSNNTKLYYDTQKFGPSSGQTGPYNIPEAPVAGSWRDDSCMSIRYMDYDKTAKKKVGIKASSNTIDMPGTITLIFRKGARSLSGTYYDVEFALSAMQYIAPKKDRDQGIPVVWGCYDNLGFAAFPYANDSTKYGSVSDGNYHGLKVSVNIRLFKAGYYKFGDDANNSKYHITKTTKLIWGFKDIDVGDVIKSGGSNSAPRYKEGTATNNWAEHVEMTSPNPYDNSSSSTSDWARFYPTLHVHEGHQLAIDTDANGKTIRIYHNKKGTVADGSTDVVFAANPYRYSFTWQGSSCSTSAAAITGTLYTGYSYIYKNSKSSANAVANASKLTINDNSQKILFYHYIKRDSNGPPTDDEEYYVETQSDYATPLARRDGKNCTADAPCKYSAKRATSGEPSEEVVYTNSNPTGNPITVTLAPGQTQNIWQRLMFQPSNINNGIYGYSKTRDDVPCTNAIMGAGIESSVLSHTACLSVYRPPAKFTANIEAEVSPNNSSTYTSYKQSTYPNGIRITSSDGRFKVRFSGSVTRAQSATDEAGGTAKTQYAYVIKFNDYGDSGTPINGTRYPASDGTTAYTGDLVNSNKSGTSSQAMFTQTGGVYEGQVRYGESITICGKIGYHSIVDIAGNKKDQAGTCVTVYRDPKVCDLDSSSSNGYGYVLGENLGRIGVVNHSTKPSNADYQYTTYTPSSYLNASNNTVDVNIYARPGDSIRFKHEICAGGAYAVNNNEYLSESEHRTTYTATGSLSSSNSTGYLFGQTISDRDTSYTSGLRYKKTKSWSSNTASFLQGQSAETTFESPSLDASDPTTYSENTYNSRSYACNGYHTSIIAPLNGHYQVAGGLANDSYSSACPAYTKTGVASDVGHTITQTLSWNYLKIVEGTPNSEGISVPEVANNTQFTARANVKIPYNYVIEPTISAPSAKNTHVVYLGSTVNFDADLYVLPRTNTAFGSDPDVNKYATITKGTSVTLEWYVKHNGSTVKHGYFQDGSSKIVLNGKGIAAGTAKAVGPVADGGHDYGQYSLVIDNDVKVGDKVCVDLTVQPADSHDSPDKTSVYGEKVSNVSSGTPGLSESGTKSKTRTACYTVAKRPTMSIEGSNAYAAGSKGFVTSRYEKKFSSGGTGYIFGSWAEYGVYGKVATGNNLGMASGATFGYATKNNGMVQSGSTSASLYGNVNKSRDNKKNNNTTSAGYDNGGSVAASDNANNVCAFSTQTLVNENCLSNPSQTGQQGMGKSQADDFRKRIYDRFVAVTEENAVSYGAYTAQDVCPNGGSWKSELTTNDKCVKIQGTTYANINGWMNKLKFDDNGINRTHIKGNAYLGAGHTFLTLWANHNFKNKQMYVDPDTNIEYPDRNFTRIIEVDDTLIIDADIKIGYYNEKVSWGQIVKETDANPTLENAGEVVQFIIIAKNIKITSRVSKIDAILIADSIDTCAYDIPLNSVTAVTDSNNGLKNGKNLTIGTANGKTTIDANTCNNSIHFRAPVITRKITLNRTYGADNGTDSIKRAEVFDLNPYTYLWSYGQMSRYSQAVTTYSRELAPRY